MSPCPETVLFTREREGYRLTTDPSLIDRDAVHRFLADESYWARGLDRATFDRALDHSLAAAILAPDRTLAGFGRVVTDYAMFAYLRDVFVLPAHRGQGLAVWFARVIREHPGLSTVGNWMLATRDAQGLYAKAGFAPLPDPGHYMTCRVVHGQS